MTVTQNYSRLFDALSTHGINLTEDQRAKIEAHMNQILSYEPRIGFFGKTGVGKSSLCNALFGQKLYEVNDVQACTRDPQEALLQVASKGVKLVDVPGVGESRERDKEYGKLYQNLLPELDVLLWVLKADDRAYSSDEMFYKQVVKPHLDEGKPFFIVLNQVDKVEPYRDWNPELHMPGLTQQMNIQAKAEDVSAFFGVPLRNVIPASANENYNLVSIVDAMITALPRTKKITVINAVNAEHVSDSSKGEAETSFVEDVIDFIVDVVPVPDWVKEPVRKVAKSVASWKVWPWNW